MMMKISFKKINFIGLVLILAFLIFQAYLNTQSPFLPCANLYMERIVFAMLIFNFSAALLFPLARMSKIIFSYVGIIICFLGLFFSGKHLLIQHLSSVRLQQLPVMDFTQPISFLNLLLGAIRGTANCVQSHWIFLNMNLAEWSFILFLTVGTLYLVFIIVSIKNKKTI